MEHAPSKNRIEFLYIIELQKILNRYPTSEKNSNNYSNNYIFDLTYGLICNKDLMRIDSHEKNMY